MLTWQHSDASLKSALLPKPMVPLQQAGLSYQEHNACGLTWQCEENSHSRTAAVRWENFFLRSHIAWLLCGRHHLNVEAGGFLKEVRAQVQFAFPLQGL